MITTLDPSNAESRRPRIPFAASVELAHEDFDDAFEADGVDLSSGGVALRSACLPEVGEQLTCRFETMPGGTRVQSRGEVVWADADGARSGEFGVRFLDIDAETRALIDELVAERASQRASVVGLEAPRVAQLELAGVAAPLAARLLRSGGGEAVFEQRLDLLELGRGVVARAGSALGKGKIAEVALRMEGGVPALAVTVRFEQGKSLFGEFDWEAAAPIPESDTIPDLEAPESAQEEVPRTTMVEFATKVEANPGAQEQVETAPVKVDEPLPAALADLEQSDLHAGAEARAQEDENQPAYEDDLRDHADGDLHAQADEDADAEDEQDDARDDEQEEHAPAIAARVHVEEEWAHPVPESARTSALVRFLRILVAMANALRGLVSAVLRVAGPQAVKLAGASGKGSVSVGRKLGALARGGFDTLAARATARPRRTTTAPAAQRKTEEQGRSVMRLAVVAALGVCAVGLGVYALAPTSDEEAIPMHRNAKHASHAGDAAEQHAQVAGQADPAQALPPSAAAAAAPGATQGATPAPAGAPAAKLDSAYASAMSGQAPAMPAPAAQAAAPAAPAPNTVPASSPYAIDVREGGPRVAPKPAAAAVAASAAKIVSSAGQSFGARSVANAQHFTLRMSAPVKALQGSSDRGGFSVTIFGATSRDKAGPIAASHKQIAHAAVINKGDHAELTIRFVDGKSPAFRVTARGSELDVQLAQ
ncbi:MAG TPA: PilZ domain-containing protein [Polyangiales bacterium]|nr:PilZ domain-containing protein [Polyangiales bacterium]